jgi:hypothetical protein
LSLPLINSPNLLDIKEKLNAIVAEWGSDWYGAEFPIRDWKKRRSGGRRKDMEEESENKSNCTNCIRQKILCHTHVRKERNV